VELSPCNVAWDLGTMFILPTRDDVDPNRTDGCLCYDADAIFLLTVIVTFLRQLLHLQIHETNSKVVIKAIQERVASATPSILSTIL